MKAISIVSGFFNPYHQGHEEYITGAKNHLIDYVYKKYGQVNNIEYQHHIIVNTDNQVLLKKSCPFYDEEFRRKLIYRLFNGANYHISLSISQDESVARDLLRIGKDLKRPEVGNPGDLAMFINSGDRNVARNNLKESFVCEELGIQQVFLDLPKVASSSKLIVDAARWVAANKPEELNLKTK